MAAPAEDDTGTFLATEFDTYAVGEKNLTRRLHPRPPVDELLAADRGCPVQAAWVPPRRADGSRCGGPRADENRRW